MGDGKVESPSYSGLVYGRNGKLYPSYFLAPDEWSAYRPISHRRMQHQRYILNIDFRLTTESRSHFRPKTKENKFNLLD